MSTQQIDIAVVGAASLAGEVVLTLLAERKFPVGKLYTVDVVEQAGSHLEFRDDPVPVHDLASFNFEQVQLALFFLDAPLALEYVPRATASGCIVIDSSVCFRYEDDVPLIIPGVNDELIADYRERMIIALPSSATSQLVKTIKPIYDAVGIESINVTVMMAASHMGKPGQEELGRQTSQLLSFQTAEKNIFSEQLAFNLIADTGFVVEGGYTTDELDLIKGAQKVLINDKISIMATAIMAPVFFGHSEAITLHTTVPLGTDKARELLDNCPGLQLVKVTARGRPTPVTDASERDDIVIGRIRAGLSASEHELNLWCVADNIRSGMALNSVQTAEILVKDYL